MPARAKNRLAAILKRMGSLLPRQPRRKRIAGGAPAPSGAPIVRPWRADSQHAYPTAGLTPSRLRAFLMEADGGAPQMQFELFAEMLQKWPRLAAVENTRRLALTGLHWEVAPERTGAGLSSAPADGAAAGASVVEHCRRTLRSIEGFDAALDHLASAIGYGVAVAELVWERSQLVDVVPVPYSRLIADPHEPWQLRVLTEDAPTRGVRLDEQPHKWIVHRPRPRPGRLFEKGLLRASALLYLAQSLSFKDWLIFSQIAGTPLRVAQFDPGTPDAEKQQLLQALETLGSDAVAAFGKHIELKFVEPARGAAQPYKPLQEYCNTEITILWLGQHLTTDLRTSGSRAAAEVHDRVREDLLVSDIRDEGSTIRRDVLAPLVRVRFGDAAPVPLFRRSLVESVDTRVLAETLAIAVNDLGLQVPAAWAHRALGVPVPSDGEPLLAGGRRP